MDKKNISDLITKLLIAEDIPQNHKESLRDILSEINKTNEKISKEKLIDYGIRITQILSTVWKFFE